MPPEASSKVLILERQVTALTQAVTDREEAMEKLRTELATVKDIATSAHNRIDDLAKQLQVVASMRGSGPTA